VIWLVPLMAALSLALVVWVVAEVLEKIAQTRGAEQELRRMEQQWASLFLFVDIRKLMALNASTLLMVLAAEWVLTQSPVLLVISVVFFLCVPRLTYGWLRQRRQVLFEAQLPDAIMSLSGALRAGASLNTGLMQLAQEAYPPLSQEIELIVREQRLGVSQDAALGNFARRMPLQTVVLLVSTIRIAAETGGELADALERTAHTLRSIAQAEGKIAALTAQGKMQAWVVGLLPILLMYVLSRMEPESMSKLWTTPLGWCALTVIAFLESMGVWLIRRIVAIDV
jgi:tight adherence protein B